MFYYLIQIFATILAGIATVASVDVNSICLFDTSTPMSNSFAKYEIIEIEKTDLALMKSGKEYYLLFKKQLLRPRINEFSKTWFIPQALYFKRQI